MTAGNWVVGVLLTGGVAVLGFLIKKAFNDTTTAVTAMSVKLDVITAAQAHSDGDFREFRADVRGELNTLKSRLDSVERTQREIA